MRTLAILGLVCSLGCSAGPASPTGDGPTADTADANAVAYARHRTECDEPVPAHAVFAAGRFLGHTETLAEAVALLDREALGRRHGLVVLPVGGGDVEEECTATWVGAEPPAPHILGVGALAAAWLTIGGSTTEWKLSTEPTGGGDAEPRAVRESIAAWSRSWSIPMPSSLGTMTTRAPRRGASDSRA